ncbi:MAG TPA: alpha/beta fold hydrolase [Thermoanaerobaculia bacterium]
MNLSVVRSIALVTLVLAGCRSADVTVPAALAVYARPGSFAVRVRDVEWSDRVRGVVIRARIYEPDDNGVHPVVVFSHGLGNSRFGYSYLGRHWASWGFTSVHVEHPGAGQDIASRGWIALYRAGFDQRLETSAVGDVRFVLDQLHADTVGVAGHSLGAYVALAMSGAIKSIPRDPRVRAAVALSMSENLSRAAYGETNVPTLHFTGTSDSSLFYGTTKRMRRIPFEQTRRDVAYLVTLRGANHSTFSADDRSATPGRIDAIKALTTLWWKAWLQQDVDAQRLLVSIDGGSLGTLEKR